MADSKHVTSMKEHIGEVADDIESSLMAMHAGMRVGDQAAIDVASEKLEDHIRELRVAADTLSDPEPPPLPPIVGSAPVPPSVPAPASEPEPESEPEHA